MRTISVLGSTGSIGTQTLDIVREHGDIRIGAISAGKNIDLLERQIREFKPRLAAVWEEEKAKELKERVADTDTRVTAGMEGLLEAAVLPEAELLVTAIVGMIGIRPTMAALEAGKDIALANKETLVTAGHLIMPLAAERGARILPVDSEHSAVFQCLHGESGKEVSRLLKTASGGPFRGRTTEELKDVTVEDALKHPNWSMGRKITIDSATLVNKGLEVMEARWLFGVELDQIQVLVQPKSVIHSMVEFQDGAVLPSWARRICISRSSMPCTIPIVCPFRGSVWTLPLWLRLLLKSRIQRLFGACLWLSGPPGRGVLCPRSLTQPMSGPWQNSWNGKSVFSIYTKS